MKKITFLLCLIFSIQNSIAQTASNYYLPLCLGNFVKFYTPGNGLNPGWEARNSYNNISQSDVINGQTYYLQQGVEIMSNPVDTNIFHNFWLREDISGNIMIGAYDLTGSGNLDSATILPTEGVFFSNQQLTQGYVNQFQDSVVSITATVGLYTNCLQIRHSRITNGVIDMVEDTYYALNVGKVKVQRLLPAYQAHTDDLVDFLATDCNPTGILDNLNSNERFTIYPNPASDIVTLNFDLRNNDGLTLNIYNTTGILVKLEKLKQNQRQINISDLSDGIYMIEIKAKEFTGKQKLIIQR